MMPSDMHGVTELWATSASILLRTNESCYNTFASLLVDHNRQSAKSIEIIERAQLSKNGAHFQNLGLGHARAAEF